MNCQSFVFGMIGYAQSDGFLERDNDAVKTFLSSTGVLDPYALEGVNPNVYFFPRFYHEKDGKKVLLNADFHWVIDCYHMDIRTCEVHTNAVMEKAGCEGPFRVWKNIHCLETYLGGLVYNGLPQYNVYY